MKDASFDLFFSLLRLKSYLLSLLDEPEDCAQSFDFTEEYLERKLPDKKEEIIEMLIEYGIKNDCDIAFDEKIHIKFKEMAVKSKEGVDLASLLSELEIDSQELRAKQKELETLKIQREKKLRYILALLFQLTKNWAAHELLEKDVDDYSTLEEEEMLRPEEISRLDDLDSNSINSFNTISKLTEKYLDLFADYYFHYGGDISLERFLGRLDQIKRSISDKYNDLFRESGLDENEINNDDN